ncbi:MAG: sulfatase-like hydrolase/transferase [Verrucomicrobia bacterium]|nr:sulfatase-like hydrolase/transferase [Verrucomicrobiota bacterium]
MKRHRLFIGTFIVAALTVLAANAPAATAPARPNVIVLLADDAGWGDYSANGNQQLRTPNIDSLARGGITLDRFYVCSVCAPTRAEFLTGRYHSRSGVTGVSTGQERMSLEEKTIADSFKAAGYATGAFGKWHNGSQWPYHPRARGFDEYVGFTSGHWGEYFDPIIDRGDGRYTRAKGYIVDIVTDAAIDFIDRNKSRPFFCYVPYNTPHSPWGVPAADWERHKGKPITQTATNPAQESADETRVVHAMVENQDANIGRLLRKLDQLGLTENTIVLYFSDNGPNTWRWTGGMKGKKGGTDEGSLRSPFFIRWPGKIPAGRTLPEISAAIDLLPTLTALAGVPRVGTKPLDGRDLSARLLGRATEPGPERLLFSTWQRNITVRTQRFRLDAQGQLFDLVADPGQTTTVNEKNATTATELTAAAAAWRKEMFGDNAAATKSKAEKQAAKKAAKTAGENVGRGQAVDPRPIPVGYREFPATWLPARDAEPRGSTVQRSSGAPNSSYFVNWRSRDDSIVWNVDVHTAGTYAVEILYTVPAADTGSTIELSLNEAKLAGKVAPGWDPPLWTNQDTIPRPAGESKMKDFHALKLGTMKLPAGRGPLTLRATDIPGKSVMDMRALTLTLLP